MRTKPTSWRGYAILAADWLDDRVFRHRFHALCKYVSSHPWWLFVPLDQAILDAARSITLALLVAQDPSIEDVVLDDQGVVVKIVRTPPPPPERTLYLLPQNEELN